MQNTPILQHNASVICYRDLLAPLFQPRDRAGDGGGKMWSNEFSIIPAARGSTGAVISLKTLLEERGVTFSLSVQCSLGF